MIRAVRAAIETSASSPATSPAPTAGPWIAETIGLRAVDDVPHDVARLSHHAGAGAEVVDDRVEHLEAAAGREPLAGTAQDRHLHVRVAIDRAPDLGEITMSVEVDGVEAWRVERDPQHTVDGPVVPEARVPRGVVGRHGAYPPPGAWVSDMAAPYRGGEPTREPRRDASVQLTLGPVRPDLETPHG